MNEIHENPPKAPLEPETVVSQLEFFRDASFFHPSPALRRSDGFYLKAYWAIIDNLMLLSLLSDGDISDLPPLEKSFEARMVEIIPADIAPFARHWRIEDVLSEAFTEPFRRLFRS